jgi:hypothetical protein
MSEFYFDVGAWEKDVESRKRAEKEEEESGVGGKRKRPSKKDLVGSSTFILLVSPFFRWSLVLFRCPISSAVPFLLSSCVKS